MKEPYHKGNETPNYIKVSSNQPNAILSQMPNTVSTRTSKLQSNEKSLIKIKNRMKMLSTKVV